MINTIKDLKEKYGNNINNYDWNKISKDEELSEKFMIDNRYKLNWNLISVYQKLTLDFIELNSDLVNMSYIVDYQELDSNTISMLKSKYNV
ncbi:hypothetical protein Bp8pS_307 [Bacillus phage vB_BpuM-BpSp]|nr:hypothetical protein Bp8pS_307 [Bacillus phage vB_BpuM-BpSp]